MEDKEMITIPKTEFYGYINRINEFEEKLEDSVVLSKGCVSDKLIDLITEFDEMGFEPTTLPPNDMSVEEYTAFYKEKLLMCLAQESKETAEKILTIIGNMLDDNDSRFRLKDYQWHKDLCKQFGVEIKE